MLHRSGDQTRLLVRALSWSVRHLLLYRTNDGRQTNMFRYLADPESRNLQGTSWWLRTQSASLLYVTPSSLLSLAGFLYEPLQFERFQEPSWSKSFCVVTDSDFCDRTDIFWLNLQKTYGLKRGECDITIICCAWIGNKIVRSWPTVGSWHRPNSEVAVRKNQEPSSAIMPLEWTSLLL